MMDRHQQAFTEEARELLTDLEEALLAIEHDPLNSDLVGRIFRAMHTIKGSSAMFGFETIATFTHEIETAFDCVREGAMNVTPELITLTLASRDHIAALLVLAVTGQHPDDAFIAKGNALIQRLRSLMPADKTHAAAKPRTAAGEAAPTGAPQTLYRVRFRPPENILLRGMDPMNLVNEVVALGRAAYVQHLDEPAPGETVDPDLYRCSWDILLLTGKDVEAIKDVFIFVEEDSELRYDKLAETETVEESKWSALLEMLRASKDAPASSLRVLIKEEKRHQERVKAEEGVSVAAHVDQRTIQSIKVPSERLDKLVNLVGELVTVQARLSQSASMSADPSIMQIAEEVESLVGELRDNAMSIRMLPIGTTFARFQRLVRDLSRDLRKEIQLVTQGEETELDKTVIERLADPMVHMIRNSIDHGIETPAEREEAGKPRTGTIRLAATHAGANVEITIADNGRGLDTEAIRQKAITQGLLTAEGEYTEQEIHACIFAPGFSTAKQVTSVSGRGVGMDVVKRSMEDLRGTIDIESKKGTGTTVTIKIPLTLAIIEGLLTKVGSELFVLPLSIIKECVELPTAESRKGNGGQLINVRGEIVPYVRMRDFYAIGGMIPEYEYVVIAEIDGSHIGFAVDAVLGEHQTVIKNLGNMYKGVQGVSGATILGDGTVALIVDVPAVLSTALLDREAARMVSQQMEV